MEQQKYEGLSQAHKKITGNDLGMEHELQVAANCLDAGNEEGAISAIVSVIGCKPEEALALLNQLMS